MTRGRGKEATPPDNPLHGKFDEMVDAVLGIGNEQKPEPIRVKPEVETWSIPLDAIYKNKDLRLDACHYDQQIAVAIQELTKSGCKLEPLSELAEIILPSQFTRIWAKDREHGVPYLNATDLMSLMSSGSLSGTPRFLSRETKADISELAIHEGTLLLTCSGTIGRLFYVPKRLDGWAATHDLIRIIPKAGIPVGYLYAFLSSPVAQKQIIGHTHGGQIDHVTHHQVGEVLVPLLPDYRMREIHEQTMEAIEQRERAIATLTHLADHIQHTVKHDR
jgi:hypothetical protein